MIAIPQDQNYHKNIEARGKTEHIGLEDRCCICGRPITSEKFSWMHIWYGTEFVTEEEAGELDSNGDLGVWKIGPDCLRKHPELMPYSHKSSQA